MITTVKGILLRKTKFSETGIILNVFTEHFGYRSFVVKSAKSKKNGIHLSGLAPLSILEITAHIPENDRLQFIQHLSLNFPYHHILFDLKKTSILMFLNEVLLKLLLNKAQDEILFRFIESQLKQLENTLEISPDFHIEFLITLSEILGFKSEDLKYSSANHKNASARTGFLNRYLEYMAEHLDCFTDFKTIPVLEEVLRG